MNQQSIWASGGEWSEHAELLNGRSGPANRPVMAVGREQDALVTWEEVPSYDESLHVVFAVALEDRDEKTLRLRDAKTGKILATLPVICADNYQILDIALPIETGCKAVRHGIVLDLIAGERPLWLFAPDGNVREGLELHLPRLVSGAGGSTGFRGVLSSLASLQSFGWKEGCILDGLLELGRQGDEAAKSALRQHLDSFGFSGGELVYQTPRNETVRNKVYGIEGTLPFVHAAELDPGHPWIQVAINFWQGCMRDNGTVSDHNVITSEGCYTVAYPMARIGTLCGDASLINAAELLLLETYHHLVQPDGIYLRHFSDNRRTHRNWARGLAWLMQGHVQALRCELTRREILTGQLQHLAEFALKHQLENGLWACYMDEPQIKPDTAGSAGIAAALALGVRENLLPPNCLEAAEHTYGALLNNLTAEGFLAGCSQSNKGGEELQRSDYRVITPYALGLLGLLEAGLER